MSGLSVCFVAIPALKSHCSLSSDSVHIAFLSTGNPLAQEIMSLYQEPDGTRRLLNYLLDNLAGAIKRSESPFSLAVVPLTLLKSLWHLAARRSHLNNPPPLCSVPTEQPPARSWISLQDPDRTWPSGKDNIHETQPWNMVAAGIHINSLSAAVVFVLGKMKELTNALKKATLMYNSRVVRSRLSTAVSILLKFAL